MSSSGGAGARQRRNKIRGQAGEIQRDIKAASILLEVRDARVPHLSGMASMLGRQKSKYRAVVLTKADLAAPQITDQWIRHLESEGLKAVAVDLTEKKSSAGVLRRFCKDLSKERSSALGLTRFGIVGLPNVGKSTLINAILGRARVKTGDRPGITRGKQWVKVGDDMAILDTPGVIQLFSGLENKLGNQFFKLALCNVVPAGQYCSVTIATEFLAYIKGHFTNWPVKDYAHKEFSSLLKTGDIEAFFQDFCILKGLLRKGGVGDLEKASDRLIVDFRKGKLGRISLELPDGDGDAQCLS